MAGDRDGVAEHAEQDDPASGAGELGAALQRRRRPGGFDHDVVLPARGRGTRPLPGQALVRMPALERHVVAQEAGDGDGHEPDRATADDDEPLARFDAGSSETVPRHARRFHEAGVADLEPGRQLHEAVPRDERRGRPDRHRR